MPDQYVAIRDKFIREGLATKEAKMRAAKIYNSKHPNNPVTRSHKDSRDNRDNTSSFSLSTSLKPKGFGLGRPRLPKMPGGKLFNVKSRLRSLLPRFGG